MMIPKLGYKDSNLEMLESESSALPFGDSPSVFCCVLLSLNEGYYNKGQNKMQVLFLKNLFFLKLFLKLFFQCIFRRIISKVFRRIISKVFRHIISHIFRYNTSHIFRRIININFRFYCKHHFRRIIDVSSDYL